MSMLPGEPAPDFTLEGDPPARISLVDLRGRPVILYFYPKDDTPGCTSEALDFRDRHAEFEARGAVVLGVSRDTVARHARFRAKHALPFTLLSDPEGEVHRLYGAWGEKKLYGKVSIGPLRTTFLIDPAGAIVQAWSKVRVKGHVEAVLAALDGSTTKRKD